jgi:hypothetical protein
MSRVLQLSVPPSRTDQRLILKGLEPRPGLQPGTCRLRRYYFSLLI